MAIKTIDIDVGLFSRRRVRKLLEHMKLLEGIDWEADDRLLSSTFKVSGPRTVIAAIEDRVVNG